MASPDELLLEDLVRARDACIEKRRSAQEQGALRARVHALDSELADIVEGIQRWCAQHNVALPEGVPPLRPARASGLVIAVRILDSYVRLFQGRMQVLDAAVRAGDREGARQHALAILDHENAIRKHCERAKLPLPRGLSE